MKHALAISALLAISSSMLADGAASPVEKLKADMVKIPGRQFSLCKYEVTQELWEAVMGDNPSSSKGAGKPVENVYYDTCLEFIAKLNAMPEAKSSGKVFRLPTAEEWEFACRAGGKGDFGLLADGADGAIDQMGWYGGNSGYESHPVGGKQPNAFGLYDMHGNVKEYTSTPGARDATTFVIVCGGSHSDYKRMCQCNSATPCAKDVKGGALGLRLAY